MAESRVTSGSMAALDEVVCSYAGGLVCPRLGGREHWTCGRQINDDWPARSMRAIACIQAAGGAQVRRWERGGPRGPKRLSVERVVSRARLANGAACRKPFINAPPRKLLAEPTGRPGALL